MNQLVLAFAAGSLMPFAVVFAIRAVKLIPGVVKDTFTALVNLVKNTPKLA